MRPNKPVAFLLWIIIIVPIVGAIILLDMVGSYFDSMERIYTTYESIEEAELDGAIRRGWIPDWLPPSVVDIHEYHDLDTNNRAMSFRIAQTDTFDWPKWCKPARTVRQPRMKTDHFPRKIHTLPNIQVCSELFAVSDENGRHHLWAN